MQQLRFVSPMALITEVTVAAVNNGEPLTHGGEYTVSDELVAELLQNQNDWQPVAIHKKGERTDAKVAVAAETEANNG